MYNNIPPQLWMILPVEVRQHLSKVFGLKQTGVREIVDQTVVNDGHSIDDLRAITLEALNTYNKAEETSFPTAWHKACEKANIELNPIIEEIIQIKDDSKKNK